MNSTKDESGPGGIVTKLWKTKGARFTAYHRLTNQSRLSVLTVSLLSLYVIVISLVPLAFPSKFAGDESAKWQVLSTIISIFIIIVSIVENGKSYELKADQLHRSGLEISKLYNEFQFNFRQQSCDAAYCEKVLKRYDEILAACPFNHDTSDYLIFKSHHREDLDVGWFRSRLDLCSAYFVSYGLHMGFMLAVPAIHIALNSLI